MTEIKSFDLNEMEISSLKNSEFKYYLISLIEESKNVDIPEEYNSKFTNEYMEGFKHFLNISLGRYPVKLTESQIFFVAVVAYKYKTIDPLIDYDTHLNELSDTYYWLYLAGSKHFYPIMEIEMFRRRVITKLNLIDLSSVNLKYHNEERGNILSGSTNFDRTTEDARFGSENSINTNSNMPKETILHYPKNLDLVVYDILKAGGIIAGGFVNSLINQKYNFKCNYINLHSYFSRNYPIENVDNLTKFLVKSDDNNFHIDGTEDCKGKEFYNEYCDLGRVVKKITF